MLWFHWPSPLPTSSQEVLQCRMPCGWSQIRPMAGGFPLTITRVAAGLPCVPCASASGSLTADNWTRWSKWASRVAGWPTTTLQATWELSFLLFLQPMLWTTSLQGNGEKKWWRCYQKLKSTLSNQATFWRRIFNTGKLIGACFCYRVIESVCAQACTCVSRILWSKHHHGSHRLFFLSAMSNTPYSSLPAKDFKFSASSGCHQVAKEVLNE